MKKIYYLVFTALSIAVLSWVLPWLYNLCFPERQRDPFVSYSPINDKFIVSMYTDDNKSERDIFEVDAFTSEVGKHYTWEQRDSLLPEVFIGQLSAKGQMPDSIKGVEITMQVVRRNSWIFSSSPRDLNRSVPTVYPLMESLPVRFKFEDPEVVMTLGDGLKIINIEANDIDETKTKRFGKMFADKGFTFPAKEAVANVTTRKGYDNGYLIIDGADNIYHLKMQANRPSMAKIELADSITPSHVFVMENADRQLYGIFTDTNNNVYAIAHDDDYTISKLPGIKFNPETDRLAIVKSLFSWNVKLNKGDDVKWVALNSDDYSVLGEYNFHHDTPVSRIVEGWIFPFTTYFTTSSDLKVYPRVGNFSWNAYILNIVLAILVFFVAKGNNIKCTIGKSIVTLIFGIFAFIPMIVLKRTH